MKRFEQKPIRLDTQEMRTILGEGSFIFVGSGTDVFAQDVPDKWIEFILNKCSLYDNVYLFQTKNPASMGRWVEAMPLKHILGTTIESDVFYPEIMGRAPRPEHRAEAMKTIGLVKMVTIEPILKFNLQPMLDLIDMVNPMWINIGADSKGHGLPEPTWDEVRALIDALKTKYEVKEKSNLKRLMR
jgi:DNA repair photolyase